MQNQLKKSENNNKQQKQTKSYTKAFMGFLCISRKIKINPTTDHLTHFFKHLLSFHHDKSKH